MTKDDFVLLIVILFCFLSGVLGGFIGGHKTEKEYYDKKITEILSVPIGNRIIMKSDTLEIKEYSSQKGYLFSNGLYIETKDIYRHTILPKKQ